MQPDGTGSGATPPAGENAAAPALEPTRSEAPASPLAAALAVLASDPVRVGVVRRYFPRRAAALVALEAPLALGERVHVRGATSDFLAAVTSLRVRGSAVARAEAGEATLSVPERARPGDVVYALRSPA